jgi:hypothetical protein
MYSDAVIIAAIPPDVRAHIPGDPESIALRKLAWLLVNDCGLAIDALSMDTAIDAWLAIGAPVPELVSVCPFCADDTISEVDEAGHWACATCDVVFGDSWGLGHNFKLLAASFGADVLVGNATPARSEARWPENSDPSDYMLTSLLGADQLPAMV